ncbi:hypothetical protein WJX81_005915 [Elliptochloris bilobata]|uniref:Purple acid phosphatase n=1 Tax=Elliptochloris bilobata TaxID=381761 RepID=A0AAW1QXZ3_9CHLO
MLRKYSAITHADNGVAAKARVLRQEPYTAPFDPSLRPSTHFLPLNEGETADNSTGSQPSQVHLSVGGPGSVLVLWASGKAKTGKGPLTPLNASGASVVQYGKRSGQLDLEARGSAETYEQVYTGNYRYWGGTTALNYTSPLLHTVILANLTSATAYWYCVGDGRTFSPEFNFVSPQAPGPHYPQRLLLLADWGLSYNSSSTLDHVLASAKNATSPVSVLFIGDYSYADTWYANGTESNPNTAVEGNPNAGSWQPVWDAWQRFIEPLVSKWPLNGGTGNHEEEQQADGSAFRSVRARWPTPHAASGSDSPFFYSIETGPVHSIFLSNYHDYTNGSDQARWLARDLGAVDRARTPWVLVSFHNPWYTTDLSYKEFEQMRLALEPLTHSAGVDVFFYGHVHAYERSTPVTNYTVDPCGAVHITIGDAGNSEGLSFLNNLRERKLQFEDTPGGCPNVSAVAPRPSYLVPLLPEQDRWAWYERALTFQADGASTGVGNPRGYCYKSQPAWSAYRESSFGHGVLDVLNETHALWAWHRNQDGDPVAADSVYVYRDLQRCANKRSAAAPPGSAPAGVPATELAF